MKFNVGDKFVMEKDLRYVTNKFHWERSLQVFSVAQANERMFTYSETQDMDSISGMDRYLFANQKDGQSWGIGYERWLHLQHDKALIEEIINRHLTEGRESDANDKKGQIASYESDIKRLKERIKRLKEPSEKGRFLDAMEDKVSEVLGINLKSKS